MRVLLLVFLVGCGEVSPAGVSLDHDSGAAGAMAGTGGTAAGAGGATGSGGAAGGQGGAGADALPPSCAYTPGMITGTWSAAFTSDNASKGGACAARATFANISAGEVPGWDRSGFSSTPSDVTNGGTPGTCAVFLGFTRTTVECMLEYISARFEMPAL